MHALPKGGVSNESRTPRWQKWKHVRGVRLVEAVALSLNIAPEKLRLNPHAWMNGKRFDEGEEFLDRLFLAERNLQILGPLNILAIRYYDEDPIVDLRRFVGWAASLGWPLPDELVELRTAAPGGSSPPKHQPVLPEADTAQGIVKPPPYAITPGPKGGEKSVGQIAWQLAEEILNSGRGPKRGYGRVTALAHMVNIKLAEHGPKRQDDSIRKSIGPSLRDWQAKNPYK